MATIITILIKSLSRDFSFAHSLNVPVLGDLVQSEILIKILVLLHLNLVNNPIILQMSTVTIITYL